MNHEGDMARQARELMTGAPVPVGLGKVAQGGLDGHQEGSIRRPWRRRTV
jgi:hypothetical protein